MAARAIMNVLNSNTLLSPIFSSPWLNLYDCIFFVLIFFFPTDILNALQPSWTQLTFYFIYQIYKLPFCRRVLKDGASGFAVKLCLVYRSLTYELSS